MSETAQTKPAASVSFDDLLAYYRQPGPMNQPGTYEALFADLPNDVPGIVKCLQGLVIHIFWASRYGLELSEERQGEVQLRSVQRKLARLLELDDRPLTEVRPLEKRLVCNCRDISLLCSTMLRAKGIPARSRCGFATYFMPNHFEDHWVVEYWNAEQQRWAMLDAQMDDFQRKALNLTFDVLDMPPGQFVTGGEAWRMCRAGQANPDDFGIFQYKGWDFIKGNLFRDLLSLNKFEVLPWDFWKAIEWSAEGATPEQLAWVDQVAELTTQGNATFAQVRALYEQNPDIPAPLEWAA